MFDLQGGSSCHFRVTALTFMRLHLAMASLVLGLMVLTLHSSLAAPHPNDSTGIVRSFSEFKGKPYSVSYNSRSMLLGGKATLLLSGSVHYVRSTPSMWPSIFAKMKASGLNAVERTFPSSILSPLNTQNHTANSDRNLS